MWKSLGVGLVVLAGCGLAEPQVGHVVSVGAAEALFEHRANGSDLIHTRVIFPSDEQGAPKVGPFPAVVFIQGGLVPDRRYRWWAEQLARAGYVVALPSHNLSLAIFSVDSGAQARRLLVEPPRSVLSGLVDAKRIAVAGHSLGGVVAAKLALQEGFSALLLEGSLPDVPDEEALAHLPFPSLSLAGEKDCSASLSSVTAGATHLGSPTALVVLDGVTHYQFTDSDKEDVARGCAAGVGLEVAHERISAASIAFLDAALSASPSVGAAALRAVPGVAVTTR